MPRSLSLKKRLIFSLVVIFLFYAILEALASTAAWLAWRDTSFWLFEDSGRTWQFDPVRGYRLTRTPSRFLRATDGRLEYVGVARGNAQGFADRDDFTTKRTHPGVRRIAVFGDSFTAEEHLGQNWPDRAEDLARDVGEPVELLNFAVSGAGLANWWSVLTRLVATEDYELDGVVFAVFGGDLRRKFTVWDHRDADHPLFGRASGWDPSTYPKTLDEARLFLKPHPGFILSREAFERSLQGRWPSALPHRSRPYLLAHARRAFLPASDEGQPEGDDAPEPARDRLVADIARFLSDRHLPALVVHIPDRSSLLDPSRAPSWPKQESEDFARALGAAILDGTDAFAGLRPSEVRALFLPRDGHWNQAGSDRFAAFVLKSLDRLPARRP
jgi:hypothetical protein